jgi:integrase-like protein
VTAPCRTRSENSANPPGAATDAAPISVGPCPCGDETGLGRSVLSFEGLRNSDQWYSRLSRLKPGTNARQCSREHAGHHASRRAGIRKRRHGDGVNSPRPVDSLPARQGNVVGVADNGAAIAMGRLVFDVEERQHVASLALETKAGERRKADRVLHGLRKTAALSLAEAGCTVHEIQAITGHKSLAEVERYTRAPAKGRARRQLSPSLRRTGTEQELPNTARMDCQTVTLTVESIGVFSHRPVTPG